MLSKRHLSTLFAVLVVFGLLAYVGYVWFVLQYPKSSMSMPAEALNADRVFKFPTNFPPDPGQAGKRTMVGIDADHDGVRDDVQRWIYAYVPTQPKKQAALRQMARYYQSALRENYELSARNADGVLLDRAIQYRFQVFFDPIHGYSENHYLKAKVLNTYDRTVRYLTNNNRLTTAEMSGDQIRYESPCDSN